MGVCEDGYHEGAPSPAVGECVPCGLRLCRA